MMRWQIAEAAATDFLEVLTCGAVIIVLVCPLYKLALFSFPLDLSTFFFSLPSIGIAGVFDVLVDDQVFITHSVVSVYQVC